MLQVAAHLRAGNGLRFRRPRRRAQCAYQRCNAYTTRNRTHKNSYVDVKHTSIVHCLKPHTYNLRGYAFVVLHTQSYHHALLPSRLLARSSHTRTQLSKSSMDNFNYTRTHRVHRARRFRPSQFPKVRSGRHFAAHMRHEHGMSRYPVNHSRGYRQFRARNSSSTNGKRFACGERVKAAQLWCAW